MKRRNACASEHRAPWCVLRVSDAGETTSPISKIASRGHARNITNAMKARLTEAATTAQQQIVAGENSRASCEVSTQSGGIQVSSKDAG